VLLADPAFAAGDHSTKWVENEIDATQFAEAATAPAPAAADEREPVSARTVPVEVDGKRFEVRVWLPDAPAGGDAPRRRAPRPEGAAVQGGGGGTISAPMQGTIVKVLVQAGDAVEAGQSLLVLEAMKMENHINAEAGGTVREIRVAAGDNVGTGDVLVVIE
jgi:acetyl-CoA/propionyl-CoA carboxylase biotin carboxyl carrier protein